MRSQFLFLLLLLSGTTAAADDILFRTESCTCCERWSQHMSGAGFNLLDRQTAELDLIKDEFQVPQNLRSCHTAIIGGYVIEGHVPVNSIRRLLDEKPNAIGLSVPGMPPGSPGMEGPPPMPFDVILIKPDGTSEVWDHVRPVSNK